MNKQEFMSELRERLSGLPASEIEERIGFYSEMIDDRIEDGLSEEDAVKDIGTVEEIFSQIISEIPLSKITKEKIRSRRRLKAWEITLLAVGSPIWFSLLVSLFAVVISLYAALWALIASAWAVFASLCATAFAGIVAGVAIICVSNPFTGIAAIGAALACAGIAIFAFFGCLAATKGTAKLTAKIVLGLKNMVLKWGRT